MAKIEFKPCKTANCQNTEHVDFDPDGVIHYGFCIRCLDRQADREQTRKEWETYHGDS